MAFGRSFFAELSLFLGLTPSSWLPRCDRPGEVTWLRRASPPPRPELGQGTKTKSPEAELARSLGCSVQAMCIYTRCLNFLFF